MRIILLAAIIVTGSILTGTHTNAADEFGAMFENSAPSALGGPVSNTPTAEELQAIAPAAGDGEKSAPKTEQQIREKEEEILTEEFGETVKREHLDSGDGRTKTRDKVGDGNVRVYYDHTKDERIMDEDDTIGVEVKLFEFK